MIDFPELFYYLVISLALMSLLIAASNWGFLDSLGSSFVTQNDRDLDILVSILIPARNEQPGITKCLEAMSLQDYEKLEILILDDQSTDNTPALIERVIESDPRMRMIRGTTPPKGWVGKNWACEQLYKEAKGRFLLFIDADTVLSRQTVSSAVYESRKADIDLLTIMPRRLTNCMTERIIYPLLDWILFCWMPMKAVHNKRIPYPSPTFGQFMLFKRKAYELVGRHAMTSSNPLDDFNLGRMAKKHGLKWMLFEGANSVEVLAYDGNLEAFKGISRSVFPAINYRVSIFLLFSANLLALGFLPLITLANGAVSDIEQTHLTLISIMSLSLVSFSWLIACKKFKRNALTLLLYPLAIIVLLAMASHSFITYVTRKTSWKDRKVTGRRIRL